MASLEPLPALGPGDRRKQHDNALRVARIARRAVDRAATAVEVLDDATAQQMAQQLRNTAARLALHLEITGRTRPRRP
jgi:hypothetical protein